MKNNLLLPTIALIIAGAAYSATPALPLPGPMQDLNGVTDNTPDSLEKARTARPLAGSTRKGNNPVLFLIGNSTMRTGTLGNGDNGQWGWGYFLPEYFDNSKITVENHALGGMSSRTFYKYLWKDVEKGIKPGDWVIIELGHNDNGPYDSGRARASIPGTGKEKVKVVIKETGEEENVYSYGEYMRKFVKDVKKRGAKPILFSLTPRNAWENPDSTILTRVAETYGKWAREIGEEEKIPFVDLNELTARKYERFGKEKVKTMFYLDRIHTSEFGAKENAESAVEGIRLLNNCRLKDYLLSPETDTVTGASRKGENPVVFTIGDSTVKNEDSGMDSMWGWGSVLQEFLDTTRISVENHAMAGRSARTFLEEGRWEKVYRALRPGDFVIMQFGHNDGGEINTGKARGELHGAGPESKVFKMEKTGHNRVVYTYGWYLRKFIMDAREKGAIPIVLSHTPRNRWHEGKIESNSTDFGLWAREAAKQTDAFFIDLNLISGKKLQALGEGNTSWLFKNDHTHSSKKGALMNATSIAEGVRGLNCGLEKYLKPMILSFQLDNNIPAYNYADGYGYDFNSKTARTEGKPYYFSVRVPDGNYIVTARLGSGERPSNTTIRAEGRRLMIDNVALDKGETEEFSFVVNKREPAICLKDTVRLNPREVGTPTWDDRLTLEITGEAPAVDYISIRPVEEGDSITTVFLCGDSTVVDQVNEPWTSWGQIISSLFNNTIAVANNAESGESTASFIASKRLEKVMSMARPGDYIIIEFGHNDQKEKGPGKGAYYNFSTNLKIFIDRARAKGLNPILITPTARRFFNDSGDVKDTHEDYPDAMRVVATREGIPLIDLNEMTKQLYKALGEEGSKKAFVHYPANTFPGQKEELADNTHFNPFGATQIAKCIAKGLITVVPSLSKHLKADRQDFSPEHPDNPESFLWIPAISFQMEKPYGN